MTTPLYIKPTLTLGLLLLVIFSYAQGSDAIKRASAVEVFSLPEFQPPPERKSIGPDTADLKPQNFSFPIIDRQSLRDKLDTGVSLPPANCEPSWGLFAFRVNSYGKIDSTWYRGSLPTITSDQILANIHATEGHWIIKSGTKPTDVAWFVYPFFDTRGRLEKERLKSGFKCTEAQKELLRAVSSLSNLVFLLYYQLDRDHNRATMIMPTERDGVPKL